MKIAVAVATTGRREILSEMVASLAHQTRPADLISICAVKADDVDEAALHATQLPLDIAYSTAGAAHQRNVILDKLDAYDVVLFFDDDFFALPDYIAEIERILADTPDITLVTGTALADGACNAGIELDEARVILATAPAEVPLTIAPVFSGYGCNMAVRNSLMRDHHLRFDEALPLYSWLEDMDLSRSLAVYGRVVQASTPRGVHLATKKGRGSGLRFGYSQVANPIYLYRKGRIPLATVFSHAGRNIVSNALKCAAPEPYIDRWGRMRGNMQALSDLMTGKLDPGAILRM